MDHREGDSFGGFIIGDLLGRGGMGIVYRAVRATDGTEVALKLMLPEVSANREFRERFVREARIMPSLNHSNIVSVYETGEVDEELFIAMELVDGSDLKALIETEGSLPPRRALSILEQAGEALDTAHESGVIHGDVKPQNLMISQDGDGTDKVLLTDFGLIRPMGSESSASRTGAIFGSIQYMAPEQIEGIQADGRADVYSLACVAFEALTGRIPFDRPNEIGVIWAHVHEEPPRVTDVNPTLSGGLNDVLRQAMAKHPDDRFLTCGEFVEALAQGAKRTTSALVPPVVRPLVNRRRRPKTEREVWAPNFFPELSRVRKLTDRPNWRGVAAAVAALLFLPAAVTQIAHPTGVVGAATDIGDAVASLVPDIGKPDTATPKKQQRSLDATTSEFARPWDNLAVEVPSSARDTTLDSLQDAPIGVNDPNEGDAQPASPLGVLADSKIAFASWRHAGSNKSITGGEIYVMNADGTGLKRLTFTDPAQQEVSPAISPDGKYVLFNTADTADVENWDLYLVETQGSAPRRLTHTTACEYWPSWSPDGTKIVFARTSSCLSGGNSDVWMLDLKTGTERNLTSNPGRDDWGGVWSPDGRRIVFSSNKVLHMMESSGRGIRPVNSDGGSTPGWDPDWCPGGYLVFTRATGIWSLDLKTGKTRQLTTNSAEYGDDSASCSPDGKKVVFESFRDGHWQLYMMNADGSDEVNVTRTSSGEHHPDWQPNL